MVILLFTIDKYDNEIGSYKFRYEHIRSYPKSLDDAIMKHYGSTQDIVAFMKNEYSISETKKVTIRINDLLTYILTRLFQYKILKI